MIENEVAIVTVIVTGIVRKETMAGARVMHVAKVKERESHFVRG